MRWEGRWRFRLDEGGGYHGGDGMIKMVFDNVVKDDGGGNGGIRGMMVVEGRR